MNLQLTPIASAVALVLMSSLTTARAQQAPAAPAASASAPEAPAAPAAEAAKPAPKGTQQLETVNITGIRGSLQQSLNQKRNSDSLVEVVTAEDIGKMPDKNVADSLQRVPGVTIGTAGAGEGGFDENDRVSLRGTNPSLTQTLINGHSVGSGDWFVLNQVGTVGRAVSYSLLPSQVVGSVVINKSSQADLVEGGIAGTVNIKTRRPLDFKQPLTLELQGGVVYADLPQKTDPQLSGLFNWKSEEGAAGVMLQVFSEKRHIRRDGQEMLGYNRINPGSAIALSNPDLAGVMYPNAIGSALFEQERKREGGLLDVQVKANNDLTLGANAFFSKMNATNINRNFLVWNQAILQNGAGQAPLPGYVVQNGTLVSASYAPVVGQNYGIYDQISRPGAKAETSFFNMDGKYRASDKLSFEGKLGTSVGKGETPEQALFSALVRGTGAGYTLHGMGNGADANIGTGNPSQPSVVSALDWIYGASPATTKDKETWGQLDGDLALDKGVFSSLKFGARLSQHTRRTDVVGQGPLGSTNAADPTSPFNPANFPAWNGGTYPGNFGSGLGGSFPTNIFTVDTGTLDAWGRQYSFRDPVRRRNWAAEFALKENNVAGYLMSNLEGARWSGNIGVRVVQSKVDVLTNIGLPSATCNVVATCAEPSVIIGSDFGPFYQKSIKNTYTDVLPSANFRFDLSKDLIARTAISRTLSRPDYSALGGAISLDDNNNSGSGGNPDLKPIRATNLDASLEWYFAPRALASVGIYHIDLDNYVSYGVSQKTYYNIRDRQDEVYNISSPINSSGRVTGFETSLQLPIGQGFGVMGNYTYAHAREKGGGDLVGASKNTYNASGFFENDRFNARVAYTFRSKFYNGLDRSTAQYQDDVGTLAASLGFKISDNLSISVDGMNLNRPILKYYANNEDQPLARYTSGRQYYIMLRAKL